jgi:PIN domain nuclease of toxin-antitoxin system
VRLLLDTHVWIWSQESPERLGRRAARLLQDLRNRLYVSTVSTLEIARLVKDGTISLSDPLQSWIADTLAELQCGTLEISHEIAIGAYALPGTFHRDSADRLLVATARLHELTLLTMDERILGYAHVKSVDARQ